MKLGGGSKVKSSREKRNSKEHKEMTDREFLKLLGKIWPSEDPEEDKRLLDESFQEGFRKWLRDEEDKDE